MSAEERGGTVEREPVTHLIDEDGNPLCHMARMDDTMWAFNDELITCPECRSRSARTP